MPTNKIGKFLTASAELKALSDKAQKLLQLQNTFFDSAPPSLAQASRVKNFRAGMLFIVVENAAVAAKLRQLTPRIISNIRKFEPQVTGIQVTVQVTRSQNEASLPSRKNKISLDSIDKLRNLSEKIVNSPLKSALTNLVRRHNRPR
ncbi:MAG: DUF721 domain-containing protein [Burkholderiales bacterium]|nr:DUF721 domain-containing protein [Burkholderiales bacterium]